MFSSLSKKAKITVISIFLIASIILSFILCLLIKYNSKRISYSINKTLGFNINTTKKKNVDINKIKKEVAEKEKKLNEQISKTLEDKFDYDYEEFLVKDNSDDDFQDNTNYNISEDKNSELARSLAIGIYPDKKEEGVNIQKGIYKLIATDGIGYYKITNGNDNNNLNVDDDKVFLNFSYINLKKGQTLRISDCNIISQEDIKPYSLENYVDGEYKVGFDIKSGKYKLSPKKGVGQFSILNSVDSKDIKSEKYLDKPINISLKNGQFLIINNINLKKLDK